MSEGVPLLRWAAASLSLSLLCHLKTCHLPPFHASKTGILNMLGRRVRVLCMRVPVCVCVMCHVHAHLCVCVLCACTHTGIVCVCFVPFAI